MIALFLFYDVSEGKQSRLSFSTEFKHCNVVTYNGKDWLLYKLESQGVRTKVLHVKSAPRFIKHLKAFKPLIAMITVVINKPHHFVWRPCWIRSCNEFNRYVASVDIGLTFNPKHLYNKLIKCDRIRNYEIIQHWRRPWGSLEEKVTTQNKIEPMSS